MAVAVVDALEVVDVDENDAKRVRVADLPGAFVIDRLEGGCAIRDAGEGIVSGLESKLFAGGDELVLQIENTLADEKAGAQFLIVEWLREVVVGAGLEAAEEIATLAAAGHEQDVHIGTL